MGFLTGFIVGLIVGWNFLKQPEFVKNFVTTVIEKVKSFTKK